MGFQDALRKAAGLIIELPDQPANSGNYSARDIDIDELLSEGSPATPRTESKPATKTVEEIVRDADGPNLDEISVDAAAVVAGTSDAAGQATPLDCTAIYNAAKLPASPFSAEQMLDMLASLPHELPLETRRQTVKVTLSALGKTMGATPETIVTDASRKIAALSSYSEHLSKHTDSFTKNAEAEIQALEAQIDAKRKAILEARQQLTNVTQMCLQETDRLDDVLEFFSLDVPPSKYTAGGGGTPSAGNA
jgi:hypothetical protein